MCSSWRTRGATSGMCGDKSSAGGCPQACSEAEAKACRCRVSQVVQLVEGSVMTATRKGSKVEAGAYAQKLADMGQSKQDRSRYYSGVVTSRGSIECNIQAVG